MTKEEAFKFLQNTKVFAESPETSKAIQEIVFKAGYKWQSKDKASFTNKPFLYFSDKGIITWSVDLEYFTETSENRVITASEILDINIEDSVRPYSSVEEAFDHIKTHSDPFWIRSTEDSYAIYHINTIYHAGVVVSTKNGTEFISFNELFSFFRFLDGTRLGVYDKERNL